MSAPRDLDPASSVLAYFGAELRRLRTAAGISQEDLAQRISYSASLVGMIETARRAPARDFALRCDGVLDTGGTLARLWPLVSQEALPRWFRPFAEIEREATSIRTWEPLIVPGLLQTEDYARALITGWQPGDAAETVEQQVAARMERQRFVYDSSKSFEFLLWEPVLRASLVEPATMRAQLDRFQTVIGLPNVRFGIIPLGPVLQWTPQASVQVYTSDDTVAVAEDLAGEHWHREAETVAAYLRGIGLLWDEAVEGDEARALISAAASMLRGGS